MNRESHKDQRTQRTELKEKCIEKLKAGSSYWNRICLLCFTHLDNNVDISLQLVCFHYLVSEYVREKYFCGMRDCVH